MIIEKGYISQTLNGGKSAKIVLSDGVVVECLLLHFYGESSNMEADNNSLVYVFGQNLDNAMAIPFNITTQPALEATEKAIGNFKKGNKIIFKKNGDVELSGTTNFLATISTKFKVNAPLVELGDASALVLNQSALMQVIIPSGSSAGTYPVQINSAGQTKVKA
jgi:phage gp45-like